jgi:hypothetical protein
MCHIYVVVDLARLLFAAQAIEVPAEVALPADMYGAPDEATASAEVIGSSHRGLPLLVAQPDGSVGVVQEPQAASAAVAEAAAGGHPLTATEYSTAEDLALARAIAADDAQVCGDSCATVATSHGSSTSKGKLGRNTRATGRTRCQRSGCGAQ